MRIPAPSRWSPPQPTTAELCPACLVGLLAIGESLPHGDPIAPDVTAAGEFSEVDAFWSIPLQGPLPSGTGLKKGGAARTGARDLWPTNHLHLDTTEVALTV